MTTRTQRERDRCREAHDKAVALSRSITAAVEADYPGLTGYALVVPHFRWAGEAKGWRAYRSAAEHARAYERYCARAVQFAAARISAAYGVGTGSAWATTHFGAPGDERHAAGQVLASLRAIGR